MNYDAKSRDGILGAFSSPQSARGGHLKDDKLSSRTSDGVGDEHQNDVEELMNCLWLWN